MGRFIDNKSMPSEAFAVIQDSEYYQRFSYVISSPLQQVMYEDFVMDIVHPSGFKMFSDVTVTGEVSTNNTVMDVSFGADEDYSIYELMIAEESVEPDYTFVWTENSNYIDL